MRSVTILLQSLLIATVANAFTLSVHSPNAPKTNLIRSQTRESFTLLSAVEPAAKESVETVGNNDDENDKNDDNDDGNNDDIYKIITTRRTINAFDPTLPPEWEKNLHKAVQAAITAPNHKRTEPWRFYVPNRDTIQKICELNSSIIAAGKGGEAKAEAKLKRWLEIPGWVVVTCTTSTSSDCDKDDLDMSNPQGGEREDYAAVCCAVQNLCLSLHADGLGTKWTTGGVNFDKRFDEIVGIPRNEYVVGTIWFGTPAKVPAPRVTKLSIDDVLKVEPES
jgi:nitroreductase